jgi:hypothetical protein
MERQVSPEIEDVKTSDKSQTDGLQAEAMELMLAAGKRRTHSADRDFAAAVVRGMTGRQLTCDMVVFAPASWGCGPEKSFPDRPAHPKPYHRETLEDMARHY